ncbi:MAG: hypothetical protein ACE5JP_13700 [Candidatus Bipolaricaulia bacterium]
MWIVVLAVVVGAIAWAIARNLRRRSREDSTSDTDQAVETAEPAKELMLLDGLVKLNIKIRTEALPTKAMSVIERIIDKLRKLLPEMNQNYTGNDLTWEVNRTAEVYLPKVIDPYVDLSSTQRNKKRVLLLESLKVLEEALDEVVKLVRENKEGEFAAKAKFLKARFAKL